MKWRIAFLSLFGIFITTTAIAGDRKANNTLFAEGFGSGVLYSVNYERTLLTDLALRAGFSYLPLSIKVTDSSGSTTDATANVFTVPLTASYLGLGNGTHSFEVGGGAVFIIADGSATTLGVTTKGSGVLPLGTAFFGYRLQPLNGGFFFRLGLDVFFGEGLAWWSSDHTKFGALPWGHVSLGWTFGP